MVVAADRVVVPFEGAGADEEELSWGQLDLWFAMERLQSWMPESFVAPLPSGTTVAAVAADLRLIMTRYPSARTRLRFGATDGLPRQVVASRGETVLEIVDAPDGVDPAKVAAEVEQRFRDTPYDFTTDWPVRMAVVCRDGLPTHQVMVTCHLVTDAAGGRIVARDLVSRDPVTADPAGSTTAMPPVEQARWQRTPAAQRQSSAAIRYTERVLRQMPAHRFGNVAGPRQPRYWRYRYRSRALHLASQAAAARTGIDVTPVLMTAYLVALARVSGANPAVSRVLVHNRFRAGIAEAVAPLAQAGLLLVDLAGLTVEQALERASVRVMSAYKYAYYDPRQMLGLEERVSRERGEPLEVGCFINDRRPAVRDTPVDQAAAPTREQVHAALAQTTLRCDLQQDDPLEQMFLSINDVPDTVDIMLLTDTAYISPTDSESLLAEMEAAAVQVAFHPDTPALVLPPRMAP